MNYKVGKIFIHSNIPLPTCFDAFLCRDESIDVKQYDIILYKAASTISLKNAERVFEHTTLNIWTQDNRWLFEGPEHNGILRVSEDYSIGEFYCADDNFTDVLQPLLQTMIECRLIFSGVMILHAACVSKDNKAIAFSALSGMGKSERASVWVKHLNAQWISGDRPAIHPTQGIAYGVPWDGKENLFVNTFAPIQTIVEIRRSGITYVRKMTQKQKVAFLASQLFVPMWDLELTQKVFIGIKQMIQNISIYRLFCDITVSSAKDAYDILFTHNEKILNEREDGFMKMKPDFEIVEIAGDYMVVPVGNNVAAFGGSVILNEVSAFILKAMQNPITNEELLNLILNEYEVDAETAENDLKDILGTLQDIGLIE